jgi:LysM repeat protein
MHNLWELIETPPASDRIRLETKTYYAKFLASLMVANNPEKYGFKPSSQAPDDSVPVPVSGMYALDELDRAMGFSTGTLAQLNPDLVREVTPPSGEYAVTIPAGAEAKFREALDKTPKLKYGVRQHRVRKGDTTASIAAKYNLSEEELMKTNGLKAGKKLKVGLVVKVPGFYHEEEMAKGGPGPAQQNGTMYTVKAGDSLSGIAQSSGVSVQDLQKWNNLGLRSVIQPGDKLFVSDPGSWAEDAVDIPLAADVAENASRQTYAVKPGDFLAKIATQKNVAVEDLIKWNKLPKDGTIQPGAKLYVSAPGTVAPAKEAKPAPAAAPKQIEHTVGKGDTLAGIAGKYGIDLKPLLAANKLKETAAIQPGQKLVVPAPTKNLPAPEKTAKAAPQDKSQPKETPQAASPDKTTYTVAKGDTAGSIADKHKVSLADLTKWNKLDKNGTVVLGQKLALSDPNAAPKREEAKEPAPEEKPEPEKVASDAPPAMEKISYKVAKGDTAGSIADKHKVSLADLTKWNKLDKNGTVVLDQALVLYVPAKEAPKAAPASAGKDMKLAAKEGASKAKPEQAPKAAKAERPEAKPEQPPKAAKAEQPKAKPEQAPKTAKAEQPKAKPEKTAKAKSPDKVKHTVDKGQSIEGIAGKYGVKAADLYAWNGWQKNHVLQPGESVTILK